MKTEVIRIRLTMKDKRLIERAATREEMTLSEWARAILIRAALPHDVTAFVERLSDDASVTSARRVLGIKEKRK